MCTPIIGVIGGRIVSEKLFDYAYAVGKLIAQNGCILCCGGKGGIMAAAAKGARDHGGLTIGILPGSDNSETNEYIMIPILTGIGYARNAIIATTCHAAVAIGGKYGTLSEIAYFLDQKKTVFGIDTHAVSGIIPVDSLEKIHTFLRGLATTPVWATL